MKCIDHNMIISWYGTRNMAIYGLMI